MTRISPLILALFCLVVPVHAQETINWKKHAKLAEKLFEANQFVDAAEHYEQAWKQRTKEIELIYKAGECYYLIKDFKKAIQAFQHIKDEKDKFPLVGLKYARMLKQDGQYEAAKEEFLYFITAYQGNDKATLEPIITTEMKGCEAGLALMNADKKTSIKITHLNENVNSPAIEFAPIPYTDDLLYYSSTMKDNQATLFRSQRKGGKWKKAVMAEGLPSFPTKHLANGSFSPNAKRFYFTLCDNGEKLSSKCEIYVIKREQSKWSEPIRLRDYINIEEAGTTTQPWVIHKNGLEILYFSSNRTGGFGGMDIWYSTRNISSDDIDFTYPVNLGAEINSIGDEITPFYDVKNGQLYYSSNGKVTLGGWDIFQAKGALENWETPENLDFPINSGADDFYYVLKPSGQGGFLVSNRLYGAEKISTQHEDIFEFGQKTKPTTFYALGRVKDKETDLPLKDLRISLYELVEGKERLLSSKKIAQSEYRFQVLPNKKLRLVAEKMGYLKNTYDFDSYDLENAIAYTHTFSLHPKNSKTTSETTEKGMSNYSASSGRIDKTIITPKKKRRTSSPAKRSKPSAKASATVSVISSKNSANTVDMSGTYYKVQLIAVNRYNPNHTRYQYVKEINRIETETLIGKNMIRVLVADFTTQSEAENVKSKVKSYGFSDAFVVKYKNGKRIGRLW